MLGLIGVLQVVGAASGATDPLQPLARFSSRSDVDAAPGDAAVRDRAQRRRARRRRATAGRPVMLDFYADWCVSCKEMERFTFTDPAVQKKLAGALLLKADVTANNAAGPRAAEALSACSAHRRRSSSTPSGQEVAAARLIGYQNSRGFLETLQQRRALSARRGAAC